MYTLIGLAGVGLPTLVSYNGEILIEGIVLQASPGIVGGIERFVLNRWKKMGGWNMINCPLKDRNKVFFKVGMGYPGRCVWIHCGGEIHCWGGIHC